MQFFLTPFRKNNLRINKWLKSPKQLELMALPANKYENKSSYLQIVKYEKNKRTNTLGVIGILLLIAVAIATVTFFLNSIDDNPQNDTSTNSEIDWKNPPCSPKSLNKNWKETTHPLKIENTKDKEFTNIITNEVIEYHPYNSQGKYQPHWHRKNPLSTSRHDYYLDENGNPVRKNSKESHIYTDC